MKKIWEQENCWDKITRTSLFANVGKAISLVPGKSEEYLLAGFEGDCHLYLRGRENEPMA
mgnify:CR=1 FL=1